MRKPKGNTDDWAHTDDLHVSVHRPAQTSALQVHLPEGQPYLGSRLDMLHTAQIHCFFQSTKCLGLVVFSSFGNFIALCNS